MSENLPKHFQFWATAGVFLARCVRVTSWTQPLVWCQRMMPSSNHHRQVVRKNSPPPTPSPRTITSSSSTDYLPFGGEFLPGVAPNCYHQHYPIATGISSDSKGNCRNAAEMFFKVSHTLRSVLRIVNDPFIPLCLLLTLQASSLVIFTAQRKMVSVAQLN